MSQPLEATITFSEVSRIVWITGLLPLVVIPAAFTGFWSWPSWTTINSILNSPIEIVLALLAGVFVHEILHAIGFLLGGAPLSSIRFGYIPKAMSAHISCSSMIPIAAFRLTILLPTIVLGVIPTALAFITGSLPLVLWSTLMLSACAGDFAMLAAVKKVPSNAKARVHGDLVGCVYVQP